MLPNAGVTAVVTSCARHDLLHRTLSTFFACNTCPVEATIVVEDGPEIPSRVREPFAGHLVDWISTGKRVGQIAAIDYAYSRVSTPYIFHMEDDWEFYRNGFVERSLEVLSDQPSCIQVWIRSVNDTQRHPVEIEERRSGQAAWRRMALDYDLNSSGVIWHGFSFNPGLRRLADYVAVGGYGRLARFDFGTPWSAEHAIAEHYRRLGYFAAILCDDLGSGYVRHIGRGRRVPAPAAAPGPAP